MRVGELGCQLGDYVAALIEKDTEHLAEFIPKPQETENENENENGTEPTNAS